MIIIKQTPVVLVFYSGIDGISVYNGIYNKMPNAKQIYEFDNEMFPYGDKSPEFLVNRVNSVIKTITKFQQIDLAVIACNTASTICLPSLRAKFPR